MITQKKLSAKPGLVGCLMSACLIVSFFLPRIWNNNPTVESFNTVLIIIILCLAIHLVRLTSSLFFEHVWNNIGFTILCGIPVFNLLVIACQFIWGNIAFLQTPVFTGMLVLFSLPAFCCYFFSVIWLFCRRERILMIWSTILDAFGFLYCVIRIADRVVFPYIANGGNEIAELTEWLVSFSPWFSLVIYVVAFINFAACAVIFNKDKEEIKAEKEE